ncbi:MAG: methylenetetrahydrofolate reductase C-terminal domain-containing protein [Candidatus Bathyarchaeota archaeon]|nr:methylenetetrahydrofolate reductase C-terminal domain-containing protein [Candidatus Bathyarchaeota archaeon]
MIITKMKSDEEITKMLKPFKKLFVVGCGTCSTSCQTGGEDQVKEMYEKLGDRATGWTMVEEPCDLRITRRDLKDNKDQIAEADAIVVMSCGGGVQTVSDFTKSIVLPANETLFIGQTERIGKFHDMCKACGECILDETGGICPITRCAKGLLNGPCGGQVNGKCEVGDYEEECAWVQIYDRLKEQDRLELFTVFRPPRDNSTKVLTTHYYFR